MDSRRTFKHFLKFATSFVGSFLIFSCSNNTGNTEGEGIKLKYSPKINEVEVVRLGNRTFTNQLVSNGKLAAVAKSSLSFGNPGIIKIVNGKDGETITKGSVIGELYAEEQKLAFESALISLQKAELDLYNILAGQGYRAKDTLSVPADVLATAKMNSGYNAAQIATKKSRFDLESTILKAPFTGKIANLKLRPFDRTGPDAFCTLLDDTRMYVDFSILESEYSFLEKGLDVIVIPYFNKTSRYKGKIVSVNPTVDKNGQVAVRASIENDGSLVDGMNVKVIVEKHVPSRLVVPKNAVLIRDNEEVLFKYRQGKAVWTYVHIIMSNSDSHVIVANTDRNSELAVGDTVIVSGNLNLADGSEVILK